MVVLVGLLAEMPYADIISVFIYSHRENFPADVHVQPTGEFVYVSNREDDGITTFQVGVDGLRHVGTESTRGSAPHNFALVANGEFLIAANRSTDSIVTFTDDGERGTLEATGDPVSIPRPACVTAVLDSGHAGSSIWAGQIRSSGISPPSSPRPR
ncbi:lactonase family protein [Haloarcula marina]|uniref:lactonase family protein n=1 Tax=Haloarcula marina TaxID=2961574 RepID=UPI0020B71CDF|nr:beta-propeller fold lactonase family protein [Halomicroarcula marina]